MGHEWTAVGKVPGLYVAWGALDKAKREDMEGYIDLDFSIQAGPADAAGTQANQAVVYGTLPLWLLKFQKELSQGLPQPFCDAEFNQVFINRYLPGEGILEHTDLPKFKDGILGISLGSSCALTFRHHSPAPSPASAPTAEVRVLLQPGDVYFMCGAARYEWTHSIAETKCDAITDTVLVNPGNKPKLWGHCAKHAKCVSRGVRVSVTLRRMNTDAQGVVKLGAHNGSYGSLYGNKDDVT